MENISANLLQWALPFIVGGLAAHLWTKYRNRLSVLRWSATYFKVAVAGEDAKLGKVEVLYNDEQVLNVHTATIQLQNESGKDLTDLRITIASLDGTRINAGYGHNVGGDKYFLLTNDYLDEVEAASDEKLTALLTFRRFLVPVLNRAKNSTFQFILSRDDQLTPNLELRCEHKGVTLKNALPGERFWGVPLWQALIVGWATTFVALIGIISNFTSPWTIGLLAWILGLTILAVGATIVIVFRFFSKLLQ